MKPRMLCTDCFETRQPQTLLPGSDRLELAGWLCLALPGWLYCAWRHTLRLKACAVCGGFSLVREARAAAAQHPAAGYAEPPPRVRNLRGPVRWPSLLATPRERLYAGAPGALAALAALLAAVFAAADLAQPLLPGALAMASVSLGALALVRGVQLGLRTRARVASCPAWLPDGREIHIELA